ncbi:MAG: DUF2842 domain-containing protein [Sphingobium sp.]|nr:DUF2842 domain-containing protein [Sphingobium sp.]MBP6112971.1 DUF2842 domain-containing protein [Sphingobium sp.]MBP8670694.1 DUF2842 domain-containing protein [Sphingobium sp.]MBP9156838.1 DUF2842 domain-containing protein [Sphingobium sp.]MCC6480879.1 DUF2842 domain-containing protein [Sphingomonadaceae bacterium]
MIGAPPPPSWRKPAGMFLILGLIAVWAVLIGSFSEALATLPGWAQIPIYMVSGIIWIMPLKPLLQWMETGRWRA